MIEEEINRNIVLWWGNLPDTIRSEKPTFIHELNVNADVLFMGFNPSGGKENSITPVSDLVHEDILNIAREEKGLIFGSQAVAGAKQYKRYYGIFDVMLNEFNENKKAKIQWEYYDLFHVKERDSKKVFPVLFNKENELKPEHIEHAKLVKKVIDHIKPKMVITNNVNTARILIKILNLNFDDNLGLYISQLENSDNDVYYYLNGTMQYGRLVEFEKERIIWFLDKVIDR